MLIYSKSDNIKKYEEENKNHLETYSLSANTCPDLSSRPCSSFHSHLRHRGRQAEGPAESLTQQSVWSSRSTASKLAHSIRFDLHAIKSTCLKYTIECIQLHSNVGEVNISYP